MLVTIQRQFLKQNRIFANKQYSTATVKEYSQIPSPPDALQDFMQKGGVHRFYYWNKDLQEKYGDIVRTDMMGTKSISVFRPDLVQVVYENEGKYPSGPADVLWALSKWLDQTYGFNKNVACLSGEEWKEFRKIVQKDLFAPKDAASYLPFIAKVSEKAVEQFPKWINEDNDYFYVITSLEMLNSVMFGRSLGIFDTDFENSSYKNLVVSGKKWFDLLFPLAMYPPDQAPKEMLDEFFKYTKVIVDTFDEITRQEIKNPNRSPDSYLSKLIERGEIDQKHIVIHIVALLNAALDTTANAIHWLLFNLARSPDAQESLYAELKKVLNGGPLLQEHLSKVPYLKASVKESFRVTPTVPGNERTLLQDIVLDGYNIPAGTKIANMATVSFAKDPKIFEEPESFKPDRWLKDSKDLTKQDHPYLLLPFSIGPRMCIGARVAEYEVMSVVSAFVQKYKIRLAPNSPQPEIIMQGTLKPVPRPRFISENRN